MEAVLKIGGSLAEEPGSLRALCLSLSEAARSHRILIVPGGGRLADTVRMLDGAFGLSGAAAHRMAILAMDQYGMLLSDITPNSRATYSLRGAARLSAEGVLPVLLPSRLMFTVNPLEASWDVTSDSISAYVAGRVRAGKLLLLTDVDGIYTDDPRLSPSARLMGEVSARELLGLGRRTSVDRALPGMLLGMRLDCYIVNGWHPERVRAILEDQGALCTRVVP